MNSCIDLSKTEYESIESMVGEMIASGRSSLSANDVMQKIDVILQSVLFCSAIEDGFYFDGESSFISSVVSHHDTLTEINRNLGKSLKKPLTWAGLVFLPAPGKRQMTEAVRFEAAKAMEALRTVIGKDDLRRIKEKLLKISEIFSGIDLEQKGSQVAACEQDACKREFDTLFGV